MGDKFKKLEKEIEETLPNSPIEFEPVHSKLTLKWVLKLKPDADEALQIAALSHDIERAVTGITEKDLKDYSKISEFKKEHSLRSAKIICDLLKKQGYSKEIIEKVKHLVENHEFGGDEESNILMDANSLAYFEYNVPFYLKRNGEERTKKKIRFVFDRMSEKAKEIVRKFRFKNPAVDRIFRETVLYSIPE